MKSGERAERVVAERLKDALPVDEYSVHANVEWVARSGRGEPAVDGEADIVIAHAEHGVLTIEVKSGEPVRDSHGRWWIGTHQLKRSPFVQAEASKHALREKLLALPAWASHGSPVFGHGVAFPEADLASLERGRGVIGPEAPSELVIDATALETAEGTRAAVERMFGFWWGDGRRGTPLGTAGRALVDDLLAGERALHRLVRGRIEDDRGILVEATSDQKRVLNHHRASRRLDVMGPAGSGKSMLAVEKARRCAREGFRTLLVCYNQRLASEMRLDLDSDASAADVVVTTFHRLCETLGQEAGHVGPRPPEPIPPSWWTETLPDALEMVAADDDFTPFDAVIVDEGQDFELRWLVALKGLLPSAEAGILWIFHDPGQAVMRDDVVAELGLPSVILTENLRNPRSIAELSERFYLAGEPVAALRSDDGRPRHMVVISEPGTSTVEAVRKELHRLVVDEQVPLGRIVVLIGCAMDKSLVWKQHRFGNQVLVNDAFDAGGVIRGLAPEALKPEVGGVLCETIRRFKGLEREVVILVELDATTRRLDQVLYTGLTRATTHLTVISPPELEGRFRGG